MIDTITIKTDLTEKLFNTLKDLKFGTYEYIDKNKKKHYIPSLLDDLKANAKQGKEEDMFLGLQKITIDDKGSKSKNHHIRRQHGYSLSITISIANVLKEDFEGEKIDHLTILSAKEIKKYSKLIQENISLKLMSYCFRFFFSNKVDLMNHSLNHEYGNNSIQIIQELDRYRIDRVDYCCSIETVDAAEYIKLLKAGDKPNQGSPKFEDFKEEGSLYLSSSGYNINFYNKQQQLTYKQTEKKDKSITDEVLSEAENIIRIEIQYHRDKIRKKINTKSFFGELEEVFSNENLEQAKSDILYVYDKIAHKGNYYKREKLRTIINQEFNSEPTRKKMYELIELVNTHPKKRGIRAVRELLKKGQLNSSLFKTQKNITDIIAKFDEHKINVVCLEDNYNRKILLNLENDIRRVLYKDW